MKSLEPGARILNSVDVWKIQGPPSANANIPKIIMNAPIAEFSLETKVKHKRSKTDTNKKVNAIKFYETDDLLAIAL